MSQRSWAIGRSRNDRIYFKKHDSETPTQTHKNSALHQTPWHRLMKQSSLIRLRYQYTNNRIFRFLSGDSKTINGTPRHHSLWRLLVLTNSHIHISPWLLPQINVSPWLSDKTHLSPWLLWLSYENSPTNYLKKLGIWGWFPIPTASTTTSGWGWGIWYIQGSQIHTES